MNQLHHLAFRGSDFDRAHLLRGDPAALDRLSSRGDARWLALWRGKVLIAGPAGAPRLARLPGNHPALMAEQGTTLFLGREGAAVLMAEDLSAWTPDEADLAATGGFFDPTEQHHPALPEDHRFAELRAVMTALSPRDAEIAATARALISWHQSHGFCARCGERSDVAMGGWQRTCPDCGAHHFPRTDPVVIMLITHGNDLLLGRSPGWQPGMYSLLAGYVEPGETIEAAVRREVHEETAVRVGPVSYVTSQPWPFPASLMMGCVGRALSRAIIVDPVEIEAAEWISRERLMRVMTGRDGHISPPHPGSIARFLMEDWLAGRLDPSHP